MTAPDLTRPDRGEALDRVVSRVTSIPEEDRVAYLLLCMSILAHNAPDVATFIMDRADARLAEGAVN
jgi:hypothetical protein